MTNPTLSNQLKNWHIAYNPYTDIFQMYDGTALKTDKSKFNKTALKHGYLYCEKTTNKPLFVEFKNAYDYLGDIENMDKKHIIQKVIGCINHEPSRYF